MKSEQKAERYQRVYGQLQEFLSKPGNEISKMATIVALLHHKFNYFFWTGFYLLDNGELIVGPYQGPIACQLLKKDTGVCWAAINRNESIIVPDVHEFADHIACDSRSNSEIVIPLRNNEGRILGVLDVDSTSLDAFNETDRHWLEEILHLFNT